MNEKERLLKNINDAIESLPGCIFQFSLFMLILMLIMFIISLLLKGGF